MAAAPGLSIGGTATTLPTQSIAPNHDRGKPPAGGPKPRPKASDYDGPMRHILDTTIQFYHAILLTEIPFPEPHVEVEWAKSAWDLSCHFYGTEAATESEHLKAGQ